MKRYGIYIMGTLYVLAGINHFVNPEVYGRMMSAFLPYHYALVLLSGVVEILLGLGVMVPKTQRPAAWGLIAMLVAIFPANINMALHPEAWGINVWVLYARLPLQLLFIYWAYRCTKTGA
jgi:uncharacterized membrane protein